MLHVDNYCCCKILEVHNTCNPPLTGLGGVQFNLLTKLDNKLTDTDNNYYNTIIFNWTALIVLTLDFDTVTRCWLNVEHCCYNYLAEDGDKGIKRDGSLMGRSKSKSRGQGSVVGHDCHLYVPAGMKRISKHHCYRCESVTIKLQMYTVKTRI